MYAIVYESNCDPGQFSFSMCQWSAGGRRNVELHTGSEEHKRSFEASTPPYRRRKSQQLDKAISSARLRYSSDINCKWPECWTKLSGHGTVACALQRTYVVVLHTQSLNHWHPTALAPSERLGRAPLRHVRARARIFFFTGYIIRMELLKYNRRKS